MTCENHADWIWYNLEFEISFKFTTEYKNRYFLIDQKLEVFLKENDI